MSMLWSVAHGQTTGYFRYDSVRLEKVGGNSELILLNSTRDSVGVLYNIGNGRTRFKTISSLGITTNVANGIKKSVDTLQLGDSLNRYTYLQVSSHFINNSPYTHLRLGNLPEAQSLNGIVGNHPLFNTYRPSPMSIETIYSTANGDINLPQYGGNISTIFLLKRDSTDAVFGAGLSTDALPGIGGEFVGQYYPPRDSTILGVGRDGQSGNVLFGQLDIGNSWGYNLNVVPQSGFPGFPISAGRTSIDLSRVIDNTRRKKMTGAGVSGFTTMYKSYQNTITGSTYEAGNRTDSVFGFVAYGDAYPFINTNTKAKALNVWSVKNAFGVYVHPQYRYTNTVDNGYSFYAAGDSDFLVTRGFMSIGPTTPTRSTNNFQHRLNVVGDVAASDSIIGFLTGGQGMFVRIDRSIGNEAGINFSMKDSTVTATIATYMPDNRDQRYLYIREEAFTSGAYPDNSPGAYIRFETGGNHANVSRISRNGNWTFGNSTAALNKRWYKKGAFSGGLWVEDTLTLNAAALQSVDTVNYKMLVRNTTTGDVLTMPFVGPGGGGGGDVSKVGTPVDNQIGVWTGSGTIEGDANLTWDGTTHAITGAQTVSTSVRTPLLLGGTGTTDDLELQSTSGVGATGAEIRFKVGNNGSNTAMTINNAGEIGIGAAPVANFKLYLVSASTSSSNINTLLRNSGSQNLFQVADNGDVKIGNQSVSTSVNYLLNKNWIGVGLTTPTAFADIDAGVTANASLRIRDGVAPTSPNAGDIWRETFLKTYQSSAIKRFVVSNDATPSNGQIPIGNGTDYTLANITSPNSTITVTNGSGTIGVDIPTTVLTSGTYTPTVTEVTNGGGAGFSVGYTCQYMRVGNVVTVSGKIDIDPSVPGLTEVRVSLPIASAITADQQVGGTGVDAAGWDAWKIKADVTNDAAIFSTSALSSALNTVHFSFTYLVL